MEKLSGNACSSPGHLQQGVLEQDDVSSSGIPLYVLEFHSNSASASRSFHWEHETWLCGVTQKIAFCVATF